MKPYSCPCCGYYTLDEKPPGTFDICEICYWEDDFVQFKDPDYRGGANSNSLREAQQLFLKNGYCEERVMTYVREARRDERRDPNWRPLSVSPKQAD